MRLFAHQLSGAAWLAARTRGYLGDKPGLGKTRTLLWALAQAGAQRPMVVCPAIVRDHWRSEAAALGLYDGALWVHSYDAVVRGRGALMRSMLRDKQVDALVVDEAHFGKNVEAARTQILFGKDGYAKRLPLVYAASGNPVPRHPGEYWAVLSGLFPEVALAHGCRTRGDFEAKFCETVRVRVNAWGDTRDKVVGIKNVAEFREILAKTMLQREPGEDVPTLWWQPLALSADDFREDTDDTGTRRVHMQLAAGFSLESILADPMVARYRRKVGEAKAPLVAELLLQQLRDSEEKVVVFAYHRSVLALLHAALVQFDPAYIDGATPEAARFRTLERFRTDPECRVFIGQITACGTGLDGLQYSASRFLNVEPEWSAYKNDQAGKRLARIGQPASHVIGQMVCLAGTLDEAVVRQNVREVQMLEEIFS